MHTVWSGCITKNITAYTLIYENLLASSSFLHILTLNFFLHPLKKAQACNLVGFVHVFVSSLLNIQYSFPMIVKEDFFSPCSDHEQSVRTRVHLLAGRCDTLEKRYF